MVSSKLLTGVLALLSVGAANGRLCYPTGSTTTLSTRGTTSSTAESSTATASSSTAETTTSSASDSSTVETTTSSATDSSTVETTASSVTDSTATSTASTDATTTATTSASVDTSSTFITITSTTASSTQTATTSTSVFYPAGLFPCRDDLDCDAAGGVCDPKRCGCINLMCFLKTTTMETMTTTATDIGSPLRCGSVEECAGAQLCLDRGVNVCGCVNSLCVLTLIPLS